MSTEHIGARQSGRSLFLAAAACLLVLAGLSAPGGAEVATFQQGVAPSKDYAGCVDTFIVSHGWAHDRPSSRPRSASLARPALMRFDLPGLGKDRVVRRAVLRLWFSSIPGRGLAVEARTLAREWDQTATWFEHKYKDAKKTDENNWTKFGGDLDETDFGKGKPGLVDKAETRGGGFGHVVELDVTALVGEWVSGKRPNHGFHLTTERGGFAIASSEWPVATCRPALLVEHYKKGQEPQADVKLKLPPEPGADAKLSPVAATADLEGAGPWRTLRFGRNSNCHFRTGHMCGYAKQDGRYPGNWGWTPRLRVGGTAGDLNHAVFYFDLSRIIQLHGDAAAAGGKAPNRPQAALGFDFSSPGTSPQDRLELGGLTGIPIVSVRKASLRVFVDMGNVRLPADTMGQAPPAPDENRRRSMVNRFRGRLGALMPYSFGLFRIVGDGKGPGWTEDGFDFRQRSPGKPWKGGTLAAATDPAPVAVCHVGKQWEKLYAERGKISDTWLEWDVTGLVRALVRWKAPNCGVVLDGRLMGGAMTLFSDDWFEPDRRPYLEVECSPGPTAKPAAALKPEPLLPAGDYWVQPMKKAHARWKGTKGTFGQYGDSITITMAFWTPLLYGERKGGTPEMATALETARKYIHRPCWRNWKGGQWGNTGNMTIAWAFANVDRWQKKMNPEVAAILFGTNDVGYGPHPPVYTEKYAAVIDRMLTDGTVPIITTLPPHGRQVGNVDGLKLVLDLRRAAIAVAKQKKVPLIDFYTELVKRQPEQWRKILVPDGLHPSYPKEYQRDWTEQGLKHSGYTVRNYLTLKKWHEIYKKVLTD